MIGAHAGGYNQESTGVVVLGSFSSVSPSSSAVGALERLLAWKLSLHGVPAHGRATVLVSPSAASFTPFAATALSANATLRALHRPKPATVSELVQIEVAPALRLAVDSVSPLTVSGTVFPPKPKVTIDGHVRANGRERLVRSKRVAVMGGRYATAVQLPGPGRYALRARTDADAGNAAGSSAVVQALV